MKTETIIYLHGYATRGGLNEGKARFLSGKLGAYTQVDFQALDFNPSAKDFQYHTITGMIDRLRQYILDRAIDEVSLIAISQGANVALNYAYRYGNVKHLMLLAPELFYDAYIPEDELKQWQEMVDEPVFHFGYRRKLPLNYGHHQDGLRYVDPPPAPMPMVLIHGRDDRAISIERSREYAAEYSSKVKLVEVASDHFLDNQHEQIWEQVKALFEL